MYHKNNYTDIYYEIIGEGIPVIIIHGYFLNSNVMKSCMEPIFEKVTGFKRIYIDLPGMGNTKSSPGIKSTDDIYKIVKDFALDITGNENFILAGYSYGGYLTQEFIRDIPEKILGAILLCPVIEFNQQKRQLEKHVVRQQDDNFLDTLDKNEKNNLLKNLVIVNQETANIFINIIKPALEKADKRFLKNIKDCNYNLKRSVLQLDTPFNKPVLFLFGRHDSLVGYKDINLIDVNYYNASIHILDKSGHCLHIEQKQLFDYIVQNWLEEL